MKKTFLIFHIFLFFTSYSFSQSIEIKGKKIEDIKSILIDLSLQDGWTIENDTTNSISFTKENKSTTQNLIFSFISGNVVSYDRDKYNFSQSKDSVRIYYVRELFSGKEVMKFESQEWKDLNQQRLDKLKEVINER
jgi:uncharacterized protein YdeI (BOF family)